MDQYGHPLRNVAPSCPCGCEEKVPPPPPPPPTKHEFEWVEDYSFLDHLDSEGPYPRLKVANTPDSTEYIKTFFDSILSYVVKYKTLPPTVRGHTDIYTLKGLLRLHKVQCAYCNRMLHRETGKCSLLVIVLSLGYAFYNEYPRGKLLVETFEELYNRWKTHSLALKPSQYKSTNLKKIERFDKVLRKNRFLAEFDDYHSKLDDGPDTLDRAMNEYDAFDDPGICL